MASYDLVRLLRDVNSAVRQGDNSIDFLCCWAAEDQQLRQAITVLRRSLPLRQRFLAPSRKTSTEEITNFLNRYVQQNDLKKNRKLFNSAIRRTLLRVAWSYMWHGDKINIVY